VTLSANHVVGSFQLGRSCAYDPTGRLIAKTQYDTKFNNGVFEASARLRPTLIDEFKFGIHQDFYYAATLSPVPYTIQRLRIQHHSAARI
jgi:hypothetical protein